MESNSFGVLAEGVLLLTNGEWFIVPDEGDKVLVTSMLAKLEGKPVRIVVANLEALAAIKPGTEMTFANDMTNAEISARLKRR